MSNYPGVKVYLTGRYALFRVRYNFDYLFMQIEFELFSYSFYWHRISNFRKFQN